MNCKICNTKTRELYDSQLKLTYDVCDNCGFIHKQEQYHVSPSEELTEYKKHNNSFEEKGYIKMFEDFISNYITPLHVTGNGLDYGSGPGPVLKELLRRQGLDMYDYDVFFQPSDEYLNHKYDLITSTEVIEHLSDPLGVLKKLRSILKPGGFLALMTNFNTLSDEEFLKWWYRRDKTHVSFFRAKTLEKIADMLNLDVVTHNSKNVIVLRRKD